MQITTIPAAAINGPVPTNPATVATTVPPVVVGNGWPPPKK